jgi:hypothetical protein
MIELNTIKCGAIYLEIRRKQFYHRSARKMYMLTLFSTFCSLECHLQIFELSDSLTRARYLAACLPGWYIQTLNPTTKQAGRQREAAVGSTAIKGCMKEGHKVSLPTRLATAILGYLPKLMASRPAIGRLALAAAASLFLLLSDFPHFANVFPVQFFLV